MPGRRCCISSTLDGALNADDTANLRALERILPEVNIPVQFGGGVRSIEDVRQLDDLGATRIVIRHDGD